MHCLIPPNSVTAPARVLTEGYSIFRAFPPHTLSQTSSNFKIKVLARGNKFAMHNSMNIKEDNDHLLHIRPLLPFWSSQVATDLVGFWVILATSIVIACNDWTKKIWIALLFPSPGSNLVEWFFILPENEWNKFCGRTSYLQLLGQNLLARAPSQTCLFWNHTDSKTSALIKFLLDFLQFLLKLSVCCRFFSNGSNFKYTLCSCNNSLQTEADWYVQTTDYSA